MQCSRRLQIRTFLNLCHRIVFGAANCWALCCTQRHHFASLLATVSLKAINNQIEADGEVMNAGVTSLGYLLHKPGEMG